jgi:hypothetical protein
MYDKDGSGSIELPEMIEIIGTLYEMEGVSKVRLSVRVQKDIQKILSLNNRCTNLKSFFFI